MSKWTTSALQRIQRFAPGVEYTGEDIRFKLRKAGLPRPRHPNHWGALIRIATQRGLLTDTNKVVPMVSESSHRRRTPVYRVA